MCNVSYSRGSLIKTRGRTLQYYPLKASLGRRLVHTFLLIFHAADMLDGAPGRSFRSCLEQELLVRSGVIHRRAVRPLSGGNDHHLSASTDDKTKPSSIGKRS